MSGFLNSFGSLSSFDQLLSSYTQVAAFRGVTFHMVDSSDATGRRLVGFLFPGRDDRQHEDLGALDGPIEIRGILIGDDYVRRAERLRRAFRTRGPGILVHPWMGELKVVLPTPGKITFSDTELRCARFEASFEPWSDEATLAQDTLGDLLDSLDEMVDQGRLLLASTLSPLTLPVAMLRYAEALVSRCASGWTLLLGGGGGTASFRSAASPSIAALATPPIYGDGSTYAADLSTLLAAPAAAIADTAQPAATPAVGLVSSSSTDTATAPDPRVTAALLLTAVDTVSRGATAAEAVQDSAVPDAGRPLGLALRSSILAEAVRAAGYIDYDSRDEAIEWRSRLDAALADLATEAAAVAALQPIAGSGVWRAIRATRASLATDMNDRIGRLPAVATLVTPATMSAWLVANRIAGDTPGQITETMLEVVRRNRVRHPAMVPAGSVEYLA
jgi:prophage DNA circulation protein